MDAVLQKQNEIIRYLKAKQYKKALAICEKILAKKPTDVSSNFFSGLIYLQTNKPKQAKLHFERVLTQDPEHIDSLYHLGIAKFLLNEHQQAILDFQKTLEQQPRNARLHCYIAEILVNNRNFTKAIEHFQSAIQLGYQHPTVYNNLGNALQQNQHFIEAKNAYLYALRLEPNYAECYFNLGAVLEKMHHQKDALECYLKAIAIAPDYLDAHDHAAKIYEKLGDYNGVIRHLKEAVKLNAAPSYYPLLTRSYLKINDYENGVRYFKKIPAEHPQYIGFITQLLLVCRNNCLWPEFDTWLNHFYEKIKEFRKKNIPFYFTNFTFLKLSPQEQLEFAVNSVNYLCTHYIQSRENFGFSFKKAHKQRLRIGYITLSTRNHPLNHLMMHFYTHHNRNQFEIFLYALHAKDDSVYSQYIPTTVDHYNELEGKDEIDIAKQIYNDQIDILIDLVSHEDKGKPAIFALKPSPIQISYLNFPATSGATYMDYIMLDAIVAPESEQVCYAEKLIHLPNSYFTTDDQQRLAAKNFQRSDFKLPNNAFIFSSFNRTTKVTPKEFDIWMQLLNEVPSSILWLYAKAHTQARLKVEAEKRGISADRLIFAEELPKEQHLARMQLADLMLDCFRCNGHTTTIDALWAGLPVLTCKGYDIISRASSSILTAMELPELIAKDEQDYLRIALHYAKNENALKALHNKVAEKKKTAPLFQTAQQVKNIEKAYLQAWENYVAGNEPQMIVVEA